MLNHSRSLMRPLALLWGLAALSAGAAAAEGHHGPHWTYSGHHGGPAHWGELDPKFEACAVGKVQSPIDIRDAVAADLPVLSFSYPSLAPTLVNNGHTIQVNLPEGATLQVGDRSFKLLQFHFHTPSEEAVNGRRFDMVAHFVHRDAEGRLGVVGVLLKSGAAHPAYAPVFEHLPRPGESITVEGLQLDLAALLPRDLGYYRYAGSLTTPPCSEGVSWMVLKQPVALGARQIAAFRKLFPANARPLQPTHGRSIETTR